MSDNYSTLSNVSEGFYKEKGSKFIAYAHCVNREEEIKNILLDYKKRFFDARHICYAWQMGIEGENFRVNDDGEPSGTAGKPILGQIKSFGVTNVLIVVVRYFGGVKLGTSGLIQAYKSATLDALTNAIIIEKTVNDFFRLSFDYSVMNDVMKIIKEELIDVTSQKFELDCSLEFNIRKSKSDEINRRFENINGVELSFLYRA
jgi:uncharacterized YigZ family protein